MKSFEKLRIKSAVKSRNNFRFNDEFLATMQFGQILPGFVRETVPGDDFNNIKCNYFSRNAPLVKPTYGRAYFRTMSVFVPSYQLADDAEAFFAGKTLFEGSTPDIRYTTYGSIVSAIIAASTPITLETGETDGNDGYTYKSGNRYRSYDFKYYNGGAILVNFTILGKYFVKILYSLGYAIPSSPDIAINSTWYANFYNKKINALPLLAFFKAYNDWMSQSQRFNSSALSNFLRCVRHNNSVSGYFTSNHVIDQTGLATLFGALELCYDNNYFTSAWQSANSPISSLESVTGLSVPASSLDNVTEDINRTYLSLNASGILAQRSLDFLKSYDDWVRRNNYSGSRTVQQTFARFGIKTEDYRSNYCHVIDTSSDPVVIGDVTATADSNNVPVGDYAGKGIMSAQTQFSYKCADFGYLMQLCWYTVDALYPYGFERSVLRVNSLDFYQPEFDGLGADAIPVMELFTNPIGNSTDLSKDDAVYGFTERYNSYRCNRQRVVGEFLNHHKDAEMNTWHFARLFNSLKASGTLVAQNPSVNTLNPIDSEYNRIFTDMGMDVDHFYLTAQFDVHCVRPMLSINQVPRLGEGDTVISRNGNEIS